MNIFKRIFGKQQGTQDSNKYYDYLTRNKGQSSYSFFGFDNLQAVNGKSDTALITECYANAIDVYSVISRISQSASQAKFYVEVENKGAWENDENSDLFKLLNEPNKLQTWNEFIESLTAYLLATGNCYAAAQRSVGFGDLIAEVNTLPSDVVEIIIGSAANPILGYKLNGTSTYTYDTGDIMHLKLFNPLQGKSNPFYGYSPIRAAYNAILTSNAQWEANASILKNRGASGILTTETEFPMDPDDKKEMDAQWMSRYGGAKNFVKPILTHGKMAWVQIGMSPSDLKLIELGVIPLRAICNAFGVDSSIFNDPANKTYSNRTESEKAFWISGVVPHLDKITQGLNKFLAAPFSSEKKYRIRYSLDHIPALQSDKLAESQRIISMVNANLITIDEAREELGYINSKKQGT